MNSSNNLNKNNSSNAIGVWFNDQAVKFENSRFFWMAVYLTAQSCLGSIAGGFILQNHGSTLVLCICAAVTMGCNGVLIALGPPKLCLAAVYLSFFLNSIFILVNI